MAFNVNDVRTGARDIFPDLSESSAVTYLNRVRDLCLSEWGLARETSENINLTNGTQEYAISADFRNVQRAEYHTGASAFTQLAPVDLEYLNFQEKDWRSTAAGTPTRFYLVTTSSGGPSIGLDPTPGTTTSGGFPILKVFGTQVSSLSAGGTFTDDIPNIDVYIFGVAYQHALRNRKEQIPTWLAMFTNEKNRVEEYLREKARHVPRSNDKRYKEGQ